MRRHISKMFDLAFTGEVDTWDIQWFFACLFNSGLSIVPAKNLVTNIGLEGTHTTGDKSNQGLPRFDLDAEEWLGPSLLHPLREYDEVFFKQKFHYPRLKAITRKLSTSAKRLGRPALSAQNSAKNA